MLDMALLREKPEWVKAQVARLHDPGAVEHVDAVLALDQRRRTILQEVETLKADRNKLNKVFGQFRGNPKLTDAHRIATAVEAAQAIEAGHNAQALDLLANPTDRVRAAQIRLLDPDRGIAVQEVDGLVPPQDIHPEHAQAALNILQATLSALSDRIGALDEQVNTIDADLREHLLWIPNLPHASVPDGVTDAENIAHPHHGQLPVFDFTPLAHWDLGPKLGIIDFERGVKLAGTRFYILSGLGARLHRALTNWMLDYHLARGRQEVYTPFMVKEEAMYGSAQFPKFRDNVYLDPDAELYLLPTAEVSVTNMYAGEILEEADLPLRYICHTPCFRREKMSAGRDVRGIKRVHQFEKVEQYSFVRPDESYAELERIVEAAEEMCGLLGLPYRRVEMVTGDLGFAAAKKYDVEVYAAGCQEWLEVSSCSNCEDFQARRANIKFRPQDGGRPQFVHTLNGSGLALPRILIAVLENNQQANGSVVVPEVLRPYLGVEVIGPQQ